MQASNRRNPQTGANGLRANNRKQHRDITASWWIREVVATATIGLLVSVILLASILGMSEGAGPGSIVSFTLAGVEPDGR